VTMWYSHTFLSTDQNILSWSRTSVTWLDCCICLNHRKEMSKRTVLQSTKGTLMHGKWMWDQALVAIYMLINTSSSTNWEANLCFNAVLPIFTACMLLEHSCQVVRSSFVSYIALREQTVSTSPIIDPSLPANPPHASQSISERHTLYATTGLSSLCFS
jgi:hypothetical protein